MADERSQTTSERPFKQGSVEELREDLSLLAYKLAGPFVKLDPDEDRYVEVSIPTEEGGEPIFGIVEKWVYQGDVWIAAKKSASEGGIEHLRLKPNQSIGWRLIKLENLAE